MKPALPWPWPTVLEPSLTLFLECDILVLSFPSFARTSPYPYLFAKQFLTFNNCAERALVTVEFIVLPLHSHNAVCWSAAQLLMA